MTTIRMIKFFNNSFRVCNLGQTLAGNLQGALTGRSSLTTAFMNDAMSELVFAQQVNGFGIPEDVYFEISTSGNSKYVFYAAVKTKAKGLNVIGLTGKK